MTQGDEEWQWVVPPEQGTASTYRGTDLSDAIAVGNRIHQLRLEAGLSVQDVEDYAGVRKADLLALEAGLLVLAPDMAAQLCMVLGVTEDELGAK